MAGKSIGLSDVRVGDVIDIVDITRVTIREVTDRSVLTQGGLVLEIEDTTPRESHRRYNLISRPTPILPIKVGSVINVNGVIWLLRQPHQGHPPIWTPSRSHYADSSNQQLADYIRDTYNGEFEVIA